MREVVEVREMATGVFLVVLDDRGLYRLREERGSNESDADTLARLIGRSPL